MSFKPARSRMGHGRGAWPVLLLLLATVMVPTACVLWFMNQAMRNERLAVRQKLIEAYRSQLDAIPSLLQARWEDVAQRLDNVTPDASPGRRFAEATGTGLCDSVVVCSPSGEVLYPTTPTMNAEADDGQSLDWSRAERIEFEEADPLRAARLYDVIARSAEDAALAARALQAQARCLARAGKSDEAIHILTAVLVDDRYRSARDAHGRLIAADGLLRALRLMPEQDSAHRTQTIRALAGPLADYGQPELPSPQRLFLMQQLHSIAPAVSFPTLDAERLAADYLDAVAREGGAAIPFSPATGDVQRPGGTDQATPHLRPTRLPDIWALASSDRTIVALFRKKSIQAAARPLIDSRLAPADARIELRSPSANSRKDAPLLAVAAGEALPGWQVALDLDGSNPLASAADRRIAFYLWSGIIVITVIASMTLLVARMVTHQMRLTRLKNDLIATVSHELKTPLASMRALVDTLLEGRCRDDRQRREYLELIGKENTRLSHLIDNFLSFSRMERNKRAFEFMDIAPASVARAAVDSVRERFEAAGCRFEIEIADGLPAIVGDPDALATMLLNLLDNACKYSEDEKHVWLRVFARNGHVCFEVGDEGVGMSRRVVKRIFDRFYQADRNLSRHAGGCGLGLSITRFIVDAHGGRIDVMSRPGWGSTFTVTLPVVGNKG